MSIVEQMKVKELQRKVEELERRIEQLETPQARKPGRPPKAQTG